MIAATPQAYTQAWSACELDAAKIGISRYRTVIARTDQTA